MSDFDAAVRDSHRVRIKIEVLDGGAVIADTTLESDTELLVTDGDVRVVRKSDVRRSFDATFVDGGTGALIPLAADDLLDPLAQREMRLWRGIGYDDGTTELVSVGVFVIETAQVTERADSGITIDVGGRDRSVRVSSNPWASPYTIATGTNIGTAIQALIEDRVGADAFLFAFTPTSVVTSGPVTFDTKANPWVEARRLAEGIGYELAFDRDGVCTLKPVPDLEADPVAWDFSAVPSTRLRGLRRRIDATKLVNGVIVQSEAPWLLFPVQGEAWDDNPLSPTRRARIGERPMRVRLATVFTQAAATAAAEALLLDEVGVEEQLSFEAVPHPALDVSQVVQLSSEATGGLVRAITETLTVPLSADGKMAGTTRRRRVA